jgi:HEAT repeat protein
MVQYADFRLRWFSLTFSLLGLWLGESAIETQQVELPAAVDDQVALLVGEDLPRSFQNRKRPDSLAARAADALVAKGEAAVPALERALASKDAIHRLNVVYVLTGINVPTTIPLRIRAARDESPDVRILAVESLPVYSDAESFKTAWSTLADHDAKVRNAAIEAFSPGRRRAEPNNTVKFQVAQKVSDLLADEDTRYAAADLLGELKMNIAGNALVAVLNDKRPMIRSCVIQSLGQIGDRQWTMDVVKCLEDSDLYIRMYTCLTLGKLADLRATPGLVKALSDPEQIVRRDAASALGKIRDVRATPSLIALLNDQEKQVAISAAVSLGEVGDRQAVDGLVGALSFGDGRSEAAAAALGKLGDPRAISHLGQYLAGHLDSAAAAEALASIRHPDAVVELAKVATRQNSIVARRAFGKATIGMHFNHDPPHNVAEWWNANRDHYMRPLEAAKATGTDDDKR